MVMVPRRVMIVDDVPVVCDAFLKELSQEQYEVDCAQSGEEAIEKASKQHYDLIFIDIVMPGIDGIETCRRIKKIDPGSVLVFVTGKYDSESAKRELAFTGAGGENYYLYKPFAAGEILDVTKKILS